MSTLGAPFSSVFLLASAVNFRKNIYQNRLVHGPGTLALILNINLKITVDIE